MARSAALARWMPGGNALEIDLLVDHVFFKCFRALVVKALELRPESGFDQCIVDMFVGGKDGAGCFVWHGFRMDGVAIIMVEDEELGVARTGWDDEASGLIGEDLASWACR
jgi:hypothetical protein